MATTSLPSVPQKSLQVDLISTDSTIIISDILDWSGTALTTSDFPSDYIPATIINDKKTLVEFILIDATTITTAATTGATIFKRGLKYYATGVLADDQTEVTANKLNWTAGESKVLLGTNPPYLLAGFPSKNDTESITGLWNFSVSNIPKMSAAGTAPTADEELATKEYVDDTAGGAAVSKNREVIAGTAGETIADNEVVYLKASDQRWWLADASVTGTADFLKLGIAQGAGTAAAAITGGVLTSGLDDGLTGLTVGTVYLSDTAGAMATSAGTIEVVLGVAISTTSMIFDADYTTRVTTVQKAAMAGTSGAPGTGNLFATELGNQRGVETYAADSASTDTYVITLDPVPAAYVAGMTLQVKFATLNTGAATINVNSLGAKSITKNGAIALQTGDILANQVSTIIYDGSQFQLVSNANSTLVNGAETTLHSHAGKLGLNAAGTHYTLAIDSFENFTLTNLAIAGGNGGGVYQTTTSGAGQMYNLGVPGVNGASLVYYQFDGTGKTYTYEFRFIANSGTASDRFWGMGTAGSFDNVKASTTHDRVGFLSDGTTLYAVTGDAGVGTTETAIAGTITNWNTYKIVWDGGTDAKFYVNGSLLATHTTNLPNGASAIRLGLGTEATGHSQAIAGASLTWEL